MTSIYDLAALETLRKSLRLDPRVLQGVRSRLLRSFTGGEGALASLADSVQHVLRSELEMQALILTDLRHSERDGATKLLFRTGAGRVVESVILRILTGRSSLCVSSQTGCAGGCLFCSTGRLPGVTNLSVSEILDQVRQAGERLKGEGRRLRNVVFMGMGEPFHNEANVFGALEQLRDPQGFHLSVRHLLVSTMGIPPGMDALSRHFPGVGLAVSLHSARQDVRDELMPLTRRWPLPVLREAIIARNRTCGQPVMIEVLMLDGITDTPADEEALIRWMSGLDVHVNLIPYNAPFDSRNLPCFRERPLQASPEDRVRGFLAALKRAGFKATRRHSLGSDIQAACGQLAEGARGPW